MSDACARSRPGEATVIAPAAAVALRKSRRPRCVFAFRDMVSSSRFDLATRRAVFQVASAGRDGSPQPSGNARDKNLCRQLTTNSIDQLRPGAPSRCRVCNHQAFRMLPGTSTAGGSVQMIDIILNDGIESRHEGPDMHRNHLLLGQDVACMVEMTPDRIV